MKGMSASGQALDGVQHLKQSIRDILTTPIGSRVMQREYGSRLFELLDRPTSEDFAIALYARTAEALAKWEPRFRLERVQIENIVEGQVSLRLEGVYIPDGSVTSLQVHV